MGNHLKANSFKLKHFSAALSFLLIYFLLCPQYSIAMLSERPGNSKDSLRGPKDLTGLSIKSKRVRLVHSSDSSLAGTSSYFQAKDPWLAYKMGKDFILREFRRRDGVFGQEGVFFGTLASDKITPLIERDHVSSCGVCHNVPYREPGAGITIPKNGGEGRNTTHFFGGGLVEMIGLQTRLKILEICDPARKGYISKDQNINKEVLIEPAPGAPPISYGKCGDNDGDGKPDLNKIIRVWFVDKAGKRVYADQNGDGLVDLRDANVAGYNFEIHVFGWGEVTAGMAPTLRSFFTEPSDTHAGMQSYDPTSNEGDNSGLAKVSNAGARQFSLHASPDRGLKKNEVGLSLDDPDNDGYISEVTEGDLDIAEWFMLNAPRPAESEQTPSVLRGKTLFKKMKCDSCHVSDWRLEAADPKNASPYRRYDGDRRFFDLQTQFNEKSGRMEGRVIPLFRKEADKFVPLRKDFLIRGLYSDFKHHDVGPGFYQVQFDGSLIKSFRTAPLWGVGSSYPYGHDGKNITLDEVIRRHGGEAAESTSTYLKTSPEDRRSLLDFLNSLVLYQSDTLPTDVNNDGKIDEQFTVAGKNTGVERFNPEFLFNHPCEIEGPTTRPNGEAMISYACLNIAEAYQEDLPYYRDQDNDGFPDVLDPCPTVAGYLDGCHMLRPEQVPHRDPAVPLPFRSLGGPLGGVVNVIRYDPQNPSIVYAGLDGGGIFKSMNGGETWTAFNNGLSIRDVMAIAINPVAPDTLYVGTGRGLFKSLDGAQSWVRIGADALGQETVMTLIIHPRSPNILYLGSHGGIWVSRDGGNRWNQINNGLPHHAHIQGFILDAGTATTPALNQRMNDILFAAVEGHGIYKSLDGGSHWTESNIGLSELTVHDLVQNPQVPTILYASTLGKGIFISRDGGEHWTGMKNALSGQPVNSVLVHPSQPSILYAAVANKGIYRSRDGGVSWEYLSLHETHPNPNCLAVHPWSPSSLLVGTYREGIYSSGDGGDHWAQANKGLTHVEITAIVIDPSNPKVIYLGTYLGLFLSHDGGVTWSQRVLNGENPAIVSLTYDTSGSRIYASTRSGLFYSADLGESWNRGSPGPKEAASIQFISRTSRVEYVAGAGGLFRSFPAFPGWNRINGKNFGNSQRLSVALDPSDPFHIYVGTEIGLFESLDGGDHWSPASGGLEGLKIFSLRLNPEKRKQILAGTDQGLFRSEDGGRNWNRIAEIPVLRIINLISSPGDPNFIFVKTPQGLFGSIDGGNHWTLKTSDEQIDPLAIDPVEKNLIGTDHIGLIAIPLS